MLGVFSRALDPATPLARADKHDLWLQCKEFVEVVTVWSRCALYCSGMDCSVMQWNRSRCVLYGNVPMNCAVMQRTILSAMYCTVMQCTAMYCNAMRRHEM